MKRIILWLCIVSMLQGGIARSEKAGEPAARAAATDKLTPINIGIDLTGIQLTDVELKDFQFGFDALYKGLVPLYRITPRNVFYHDLNALAEDFNTHNLDLVLTNALNYLRIAPATEANRDNELYGLVVGEKKSFRYLLLVRADSGISHFKNLHRKIVIIKTEDETGRMFLETLTFKAGQTPADQFFSAITEAETFSQAVLALFFEQGDACLVSQMIFENMVALNSQIGDQVTILGVSPALANEVVFLHKNLPQEVKQTVLNTLLQFETNPIGQRLFRMVYVDRIVPFDDADLASVKALLEDYATLTQQP